MEATITLQELASKLNGKFWSKEGKERVYLERGYNTKKMSTSTYVEIVDGDFVVKCFVNCDSQDYRWCKSQSEIVINDVGQELKEALATEYFYVTDTDGEILDDCCRTPKDGLIDLYIGGGLFLTESDAKIFITSECVDVVVKSISRIDFDNLEVEHIIKEGISKAETPIAEKQNIELPQGIRVSHERFGMGVIIEELQDGENAKLKIVFENSGEKLLLKKFCQLTYLND